MFGEILLIGAYWGPQNDSPETCAARVAECLVALGRLHPTFASWYQLPTRKNRAKPGRISIDVPLLTEDLLAGMTYPDVGSQPFADMGYRVDYLNDERALLRAQISIQCGGTFKRLKNLCLLHIPNYSPDGLAPDQVANVLRTLILVWNPETAVATCHALKAAVVPDGNIDDAGWIMFRRGQSPKSSQLPAATRVEQIPDRGALIIATEDITMPPSASQIEAVRQVVKSISDET